MHILALEPYYDGSHKAFLEGWSTHSRHPWQIGSLPGYKWKWRMRHGAVTFAQQWGTTGGPKDAPELLFCSDMLNLAEFLGLAPPPARNCPSVLYFHENQLTYPVRHSHERDLQFAMTNMTSALAADAVWFNSEFHRQEFLSALEGFLKRMPDYQPLDAPAAIHAKSQVVHPGIHALPCPARVAEAPLHILWAARWEHDKNPEAFFHAIDALQRLGTPFQLSVIGQHFETVPPVFAQAQTRLRKQIVHWGFQPERNQYETVLGQADVVVSTAQHEFFGIGIIEAIVAGARPLLPRRLAYPEILNLARIPEMAGYFYDGSVAGLCRSLDQLARAKQAGTFPSPASAIQAVQRFLWDQQAPRLDRMLEAIRIRRIRLPQENKSV